MKPSREQRKAYKAAIAALAALVATSDEGSIKEAATRACDELLTLRYGPASPPAPA